MRSNDSAITALTPAGRAFGRPIAAAARAVVGAGQHDARDTLRAIVRGSVEDRHELALGKLQREAAFDVGREPVAQPDVGERSAHHHVMIAATADVRVEILLRDALSSR
jgi:hypothetical protein